MKTKFNPRFTLLMLIVIGAAGTRLFTEVGHTPIINMTPIGAMALFGGAYFTNKWKAILFPLLALLASDLLINTFVYHGTYGIFYQGWYVTYAIFTLIVFIGKWVIKKVNFKYVLLASIAASFSHWIIIDYFVWIFGIDITTGLPFTKDIAGFIKCYALALPYLQSFMLGTALYGLLMFGIFEFAQRKFPTLALQKNI